MKTISANPSNIERKWWVVDLNDQVVGRAATVIANVLRGKHKAMFTPHFDAGDFVVAINAEKVKLTGKKLEQKLYRHHTGHPGGLREVTAGMLLATKPDEIIRHAVRKMLPKNTFSQKLIHKLKVYAGGEHPHAAQQPQTLELK